MGGMRPKKARVGNLGFFATGLTIKRMPMRFIANTSSNTDPPQPPNPIEVQRNGVGSGGRAGADERERKRERVERGRKKDYTCICI